MKIDRLVSILSVLLQKEKVTTAYLAEKFEVSKRTILRDIESLNKAGIPIVTTQGNGGGVSIMENYKLDKTLLSSQDLRSIIAGLKGLDSVSGGSQYKHLMEKLHVDSSAVSTADNHFIITLSGWDKNAFADKIELINAAMEQKRRITFCYYSPSGDSERVIEPYHIIFQWSSWYVWGYCVERHDFRMFKLSRIAGLQITDEPIESREAPEYQQQNWWGTDSQVETTVRFDKSVKWRLIDEWGVDFLKYDEDGNIVISFTWSDLSSLFHFILSFGDKAEILEPIEYRKQFVETLKNMQTKYDI